MVATAQTFPFNAAVLESTTEHLTVIQEWNNVVKNLDVVGSVGRQLSRIETSELDDETKDALYRETIAIGDSAQALGRLVLRGAFSK